MKTRRNKTGTKGRGTFLRGWSKAKPGFHEKTIMMSKCGKKCFLGPNKSFPICTKNTCKVNRKGVYSAYIRAREYMTIRGTRKYKKIAEKSYKMLYK
uniref:Uncharacterized protein n=1 Tax=viral metagenome TaxID=1070528 RepID=A0A6C0KPP1_9ZZZZ